MDYEIKYELDDDGFVRKAEIVWSFEMDADEEPPDEATMREVLVAANATVKGFLLGRGATDADFTVVSQAALMDGDGVTVVGYTKKYPPVHVDENGLATQHHVAFHHEGDHGEVTLCGVYIDYETWKGAAPNAPWCPVCEARDS